MSKIKNFSWGNYPYFAQKPMEVHWRTELSSIIHKIKSDEKSTLVYGKGRSYGDSCLAKSNEVISTINLNNIISVDWEKGLITAEAGITLEEILSFSIPNGWFLPVSPGTKFITLGGAIANDIHGKNHHKRGTFGNHVLNIGLFRSDLGNLICNPNLNSNLFSTTIGGLGLTGVIKWAEIKMVRISSSSIMKFSKCFHNLEEFFNLSSYYDDKYEFSVSWVDCLASKSKLGKGIYMAGNFANDGRLRINKKSKFHIPFTPPFSLVNKLSLKTFNTFYWLLSRYKQGYSSTNYDPFFYPLDSISRWNRIYGLKGFQQYQLVIPEESAKKGVKEVLRIISKAKTGSFLAVLKKFGKIKSPGLLSFPLPGTTLALDFPQSIEPEKKLFPLINDVVKDYGGRLYPAKDAQMSSEFFKSSYPLWERLENERDPVLFSHFWDRVLK